MIKAIFYARFHPEKGPIIVHQVPADSISSSTGTAPTKTQGQTLLDFPLLSPYLLPPQALCNQLLTLRSPTSPHLILSHPVCIVDPARYDRNEFIFNLGVVLSDRDAESQAGVVESWKGVVRKVAAVLRTLETDGGVLSLDEQGGAGGAGLGVGVHWSSEGSRVYALCEIIREDLNAYGECMIPIGPIHTLSLRLSPAVLPAPEVLPHHVPTLLLPLSSPHLSPHTADIVLSILLPFIDGINPVFRIAELADADVDIACQAVAALVENGVAVVADVFSFGGCWATAEGFGEMVAKEGGEIVEEGRRYVTLPSPWDEEDFAEEASDSDGDTGVDEERGVQVSRVAPLTRDGFIRLLASFKQGVPLRQWILEHREDLRRVDVRRLIQFATLKGFLYRVHKYAVSSVMLSETVSSSEAMPTSRSKDSENHKHGTENGSSAEIEPPRNKDELLLSLQPYLDGQHCFDRICSDLRVTDQEIMAALKGRDVVVMYH